MGLETTANLIIAAFELSAVRLIRGAMRAADMASGRGQPASGLGPAPNAQPALRRNFEPQPVYEPRQHITPSPRFEDRPVYSAVTYEVRPEQLANATTFRPCEPTVAVGSVRSDMERPIPPVWKTLPPIEHPPTPRRPIKVIRHYPDMRNRGIVIDVHV